MNTYTYTHTHAHTLIIAFFINVNPNVLSRRLLNSSTSKTIKCYEVVQKKKADPYGLF